MGLCASTSSTAEAPNTQPTGTVVQESANTKNSKEFPKLGLPLSEFNKFISLCGGPVALEGLTTTDVNEKFLKPITASTHQSYVEFLKQQQEDNQQEVTVAIAQVFISHAWRYQFLDVVNTLGYHLRNEPDIIIWFDLFSNNQHDASENDFEWWCTTFKSAIGQFQHTVLILSPWQNPIPLTRAWCLFEILCSIITKAKFEIAVTAKDRTDFIMGILYEPNALDLMLGNVDVHKSEAFKAIDKEKIFQAVETLIGMNNVNKTILEMMREWTIQTAKIFIDEEDNELTKITYIGALAYVYEGLGQYDEAEALYKECLSRRMELLGEDNDFTQVSMNNLAVLYTSLGRYTEAITLFEKCLIYAKNTNMDNGLQEILTSSNLACCYDNIGDSAKAEPLYIDCYEKICAMKGEHDRDALVFLNNLGYFYTKLKRFDEAESAYKKCMAIREELYGENHPDTLVSYGNLAMMYYVKGDCATAESMWSELLEKYKVRLGETHPLTLDVEANLSNLHSRDVDKNTAP